MSQLFNNKYRIPSARLEKWNYAKEAMYFVTICTKNNRNYFGKIIRDKDHIAMLQPTDLGRIAHAEWYKSIEMRQDMNLEMGEFVVMPNHIHGIIIIGQNAYNHPRTDARHRVSNKESKNTPPITKNNEEDAIDFHSPIPPSDARHRVSIKESKDTPSILTNDYKNQFGPQSNNLASIIRGYKSAVTTYARKNGIDFDWHPRFHDHIIKSIDAYHNISNYIINNPTKWAEDKFYK
jgi:putative transposase